MMPLNNELDALEKLFQLMDKYQVTEVSVDYVHVVKSKFTPSEPTAKQLLEQHILTPTQNLKEQARHKVEEVEAWLNKGPDVK